MVTRAFTAYLAGPITGLHYDGAQDWRAYAVKMLGAWNIKALSPLRGKEFLRSMGELTASCAGYGALHPLASPRGIMTRDRFDCTTSDVILVNLLGAKKVSIGTVMEIAWADTHRVPIVAVMEPGNIHEHAMVDEALGYRVNTVDEAIHVVRMIAGNG